MKQMSLKAKVTIFSALIILLIALIVVYTCRTSRLASFEEYKDLYLSASETLWSKIAESEATKLQSGLNIYTRDRKFIKAMRKNDKQALQDPAWAAFRALITSEIAYKAFFLNPAGEVVFSRASNASEILQYNVGDFVKNASIQQTLKDGKSRYGIAQENDDIVFIFTFPIYARGKLKGIGVYISDVNRSLRDFANSSRTEAAFILNENIVASTNQNLFNDLKIDYKELKTERLIRKSIGEKEYGLSIIPIIGAEDSVVTHMIALFDKTEFYSKQDSRILTLYILLSAVTLISLIGIYLFMNHAFKPLKSAISIVKDVKNNSDLTKRMPTDAADEINQIADAFNSILEAFDEIIKRIASSVNKAQESSDRVATSSKKLQSDVTNQSEETNKAATAITEMSAAVQQVARTASSIYDSTNDVVDKIEHERQITSKTTKNSRELTEQMEKGSQIMQNLHQDSMNIGTVLEVIRGIAEQTNLLALNAAIEAARAGDQGRGFAVVADEVRGLASRTAQSTEDIQNMVESLQEMAEQAVSSMTCSHQMAVEVEEQTTEAMTILQEIHDAANALADMNQQINVATEEQSAVAEEINKNIIHINQIAESSDTDAKTSLSEVLRITDEIKEIYSLIERYKVN